MATTILSDEDGITLIVAENGVFTLLLDRGPNLFNPTLVQSLSDAIGRVESASHPKSLVVRGIGKFFSNGLDLDFMTSHSAAETASMIESVWRLLARILVLDCRTVAAVNGHAFGAGLFLALSCDYRVMRTERGYLCWPEVNLGMRLAKGFAELSKAKVSFETLRNGALTGKRYGSADALKAGLIDAECNESALAEMAERMAEGGLPESLGLVNFDSASFRDIKIELYCDAYRALAFGWVDAEPHSRL